MDVAQLSRFELYGWRLDDHDYCEMPMKEAPNRNKVDSLCVQISQSPVPLTRKKTFRKHIERECSESAHIHFDS